MLKVESFQKSTVLLLGVAVLMTLCIMLRFHWVTRRNILAKRQTLKKKVIGK